MELTKIDAPETTTINWSEDVQSEMCELGDLQLALVGGGIGNVILG